MSTGARLTLKNFGKEITISISGTVIDDIGITIPGVAVSLLTGKVVIATATSDKRGEFQFTKQPVKVGIYAIRAIKRDYAAAEDQLTLTWDMNEMSFDVILRIEPRDKPKVEIDPAEEARLDKEDLLEDQDEEDYEPRRSGRFGYEGSQGSDREGSGNSDRHRDSAPVRERLERSAKYIRVRVLFATDRNRQLSKDPKNRFGNGWAENEHISFGACDVQLPSERKVGDLPRPSFFKLQFREDPNKHIILKSCEDLEETNFYKEVSRMGPFALLFVHGYCVTFAEAIYRTAQIVDDLDFTGAPICYSWPSKGNFLGYTTDEDSIVWTRSHLFKVLRETMKLKGIETINIIAHSMGNRAVIECLDQLSQEFSGSSKFSQVVFAAPDVNTGIFRQYLDKIKGAAHRFTLYASSHDKPLKWSQWFSRWDRAGQGGSKLVVHPILDSIDASAIPCGVLDHSYFGSTRTVLSDIHELFKYNAALPRFAIDGPKNDGSGIYWVIKR